MLQTSQASAFAEAFSGGSGSISQALAQAQASTGATQAFARASARAYAGAQSSGQMSAFASSYAAALASARPEAAASAIAEASAGGALPLLSLCVLACMIPHLELDCMHGMAAAKKQACTCLSCSRVQQHLTSPMTSKPDSVFLTSCQPCCECCSCSLTCAGWCSLKQ